MPKLSAYDYGDRFNKEDRQAMAAEGYSRDQIRKYSKTRVAKEHMTGGQLRRSGQLEGDVVSDINDYDARGVAGQGVNINDHKKAGWTRQDIKHLRSGGFSDEDIAAKMKSDMDSGNFRMGKKAKAFMDGDYSFGKPSNGGGGGGDGGGGNTNPGPGPAPGPDPSPSPDPEPAPVAPTNPGTGGGSAWDNSNNQTNVNIENSGNTNANQSNNTNVVGDNNSVSNNQTVHGGSFSVNAGNSANSYMNNYKDGVKQNMFGGAFSSGIFS